MAPKERPILFSAPMVRAILEGRKTVTRRIVTPAHAPIAVEPYDSPNVFMYHDDGTPLDRWFRFTPETSALIEHMRLRRPCWAPTWRSSECRRPTMAQLRRTKSWQAGRDLRWSRDEVAGLSPYGQPGDRLWVRETWAPWATDVEDRGEVAVIADAKAQMPWASIVYRAEANGGHVDVKRWRPSIFMPRWASRILLEVVSVRVERLQEITEEDARREGVSPLCQHQPDEDPRELGYCSGGAPSFAIDNFHALWDAINPRAPWASSPWVWRVEFRRLQ